MEQVVAETPRSNEQQIDHGQTSNACSLGSDTHFGRDPSGQWHPKRQPGCSSFRVDNIIRDRDKPVCRDFLRGQCARETSCKYRHCESDNQNGFKSSVCHDFLRGQCKRMSCRFLHPESNESNGCSFNGMENIDAAAGSGRSQAYGQMTESDPRGRYFVQEPQSRSPCRKFQKGICYRGDSCRYLHSEYPTLHDRPSGDQNTQLQHGVPTTLRNPSFGEPRQGDQPRSRSPCRKFQKGICYRGDSCRYLHSEYPTLHDRPSSDRNTQVQHGVPTISRNPSFGERNSGNTGWMSPGQEEGDVATDRSTRFNFRERRSRSPCRNYLRGRCNRGAYCPHLHIDIHAVRSDDYSTQQKQVVEAISENQHLSKGSVDIKVSYRSGHSVDDIAGCEQNRPLEDSGGKPRPEVCLKYCRGRCTSGESCRYLHSFHDYAKSASDWTKQPHIESANGSGSCRGTHRFDGPFEGRTNGQYAGKAGEPNIYNEKVKMAAGNQHSREINGEVSGRNCEFSEAGDHNVNLKCLPFKRQRSGSPFTARYQFDCRRMRRDEYENNFHRQRSRSRSPVAGRDDFDRRKIRRYEYQDSFPQGGRYTVAPFRYSFSRSYRFNGPKYSMHREPESRVPEGPTSHGVNEESLVMRTEGCVTSQATQLDQCPNGTFESVKDAVQASPVDEAGGGSVRNCSDIEISKGDNAVNSLVALSGSTAQGENQSSPMDTNVCASSKDNNAEVNADLSQNESGKTDGTEQAPKNDSGKVTDSSTHGPLSSSDGHTFLSQPGIASVARVSDDGTAQEVAMVSDSVQGLEEGKSVVKEIQQTIESAQATTEELPSVSCHSQSNHGQMPESSLKAASSSSRRKLLVLDVNGLLADIVTISEVPRGYKPDITVAMKAVFKRPFCDDFLKFCFERFDVGIWSSRTKKNVERVVDFLMFNSKQRLLFCWDQAHCTETGYKTVENRDKPLVLKELKKLWEKQEPDLPWDKGFYNETNTVLLDDSPYKALRNPPYTAIFPYAYKFRDFKDRSLGPGGDLRVYLERLAAADDVQKFIQENPFGQRPITKSNLSWGFYSKIIGDQFDQQGKLSCTPAVVEVSEVSASEQEQTANGVRQADQQKGNTDNTPATESAGDHAEQQACNSDKTSAVTASVGAPTNQEEAVNKTAVAEDLGVPVNRQEEDADNNPVANSNQQNEDAENTPVANSSQKGKDADSSPVANSNQQEIKAGDAHANQPIENFDPTPESKIIRVDTDQREVGTDASYTADAKVEAANGSPRVGNVNEIHDAS